MFDKKMRERRAGKDDEFEGIQVGTRIEPDLVRLYYRSAWAS